MIQRVQPRQAKAFTTELTEPLFSWVLPVLSVPSMVKFFSDGSFCYAFPFASDGEVIFFERHKLGA
jgi:hypothetical protein